MSFEDPKHDISKSAKEEFGAENIDDTSYISLRSSIITSILKNNYDIEEIRICITQLAAFLENKYKLTIEPFLLGIISCFVSFVAIVIAQTYLIGMLFFIMVNCFLLIFIIGIITYDKRYRKNNREIFYLKFKIQCIDYWLSEKKGKPKKKAIPNN